jgi:hypothetical protein
MSAEMLQKKQWRVVAHLCCLSRCLLHGHPKRARFFLAGIRRELGGKK